MSKRNRRAAPEAPKPQGPVLIFGTVEVDLTTQLSVHGERLGLPMAQLSLTARGSKLVQDGQPQPMPVLPTMIWQLAPDHARHLATMLFVAAEQAESARAFLEHAAQLGAEDPEATLTVLAMIERLREAAAAADDGQSYQAARAMLAGLPAPPENQ